MLMRNEEKLNICCITLLFLIEKSKLTVVILYFPKKFADSNLLMVHFPLKSDLNSMIAN